MRYWVTFRIDARYCAEVEANDVQEAIKKAEDIYVDEDFGAARDIDGEPVLVEDENNNYVLEV